MWLKYRDICVGLAVQRRELSYRNVSDSKVLANRNQTAILSASYGPLLFGKTIIEPPHDKTNKMTVRPV